MSVTVRHTTHQGEAPPAPASTLVIFGAGGDLAKRLLVPALYNLTNSGLLDQHFRIIGFDRIEHDDDSFRDYMRKSLQELVSAGNSEFGATQLDADVLGRLTGQMHYMRGDLTDPQSFQALGQKLAGSTGEAGAVFYLAVSPRFFGSTVEQLSKAGLMQQGDGRGFRRVVIEKPFGSDLASAKALNQQILSLVDESQVYRIDHFLGKETVQNIMALRFANGIFEPLWNRHYIDYVEISAAETVSVEQRGRFYEPTGALRDMVPNHMFQLLGLTAMEPPNSFDADDVRDEKAKVVQAIRHYSVDEAVRHMVRGQYTEGTVNGHPVGNYRDAQDVAKDSNTETYIAMQFWIDNWRWVGVPFYVRTGKSLTARRTEIGIRFRGAPGALFRKSGHVPPANLLRIRVQPDEGMSLRFETKVPGPAPKLAEVEMDFRYADVFGRSPATGYETLVYDVLIGDPVLFQRADNIEAGWAAVQPMLDAAEAGKAKLEFYQAGSEGPEGAAKLLERAGHKWLALSQPLPDGQRK